MSAKVEVIYQQRISGFWFSSAVGLLLALIGGWITLTEGEGLWEALNFGGSIALGVSAIAYGMAYLTRRNTVLILATDGITLSGCRASPLGRGQPFAIPIFEVSGWRWLDVPQSRTSRAAVLEWSHAGEVFRLPPLRARTLKISQLRVLAPSVVDDAIRKTSITLMRTARM